MLTKAFYQKGKHSFQKDALLCIFSSEFEAAFAVYNGRANLFKIIALKKNEMLLKISL